MKFSRSGWGCLTRVLMIVFLFASCVKMQETNSISDVDVADAAMTYLMKFGYLPDQKKSVAIITEDTMSHAIAEFQSFASLNETGVLDKDTLKFMSLSRCGVKDKKTLSPDKRKKRYVGEGSKWRENNLKYKITTYPQRGTLGKSVVDAEVSRAFSVWSQYTDLKFQQVQYGSVNIEIKFARRAHGDYDPFDGVGGVLAHANYPQFGGSIHFDDDEYWTVNSYSGTNLFQVAAHEIGHALGLEHSRGVGLMAPFYQQYHPNFQLHPNDIRAIQALYGAKKSPPRNPPPVTTPALKPAAPTATTTLLPPTKKASVPDLCKLSKIDAVFHSGINIFFFLGDYYWKMVNKKLVDGYPKLIKNTWRELPGNIDAAFGSEAYIYFFKGSKYWRYTGERLDKNYPREISADFRGIPNNLDAATITPSGGLMFFFKGFNFYLYNLKTIMGLESVGPIPVQIIYSLHNKGIDTVYFNNDSNYVFKDSEYIAYNSKTFQVVGKGNIKTDLFGCPKK